MCGMEKRRRIDHVIALLVVFLLGAPDASFSQEASDIMGSIIYVYSGKCSSIRGFIVRLKRDNDVVSADDLEDCDFKFINVKPKDGMAVIWSKKDSLENGSDYKPPSGALLPFSIDVVSGKLDGQFKYKDPPDAYLILKSAVEDELRQCNFQPDKNGFLDFCRLREKKVDFNVNYEAKMLKDLVFYVNRIIKRTGREKLTAEQIDFARELRKYIIDLLVNNKDISDRGKQINTHLKAWVEFAQYAYRDRQRNFAKEPYSVNSQPGRFTFFQDDDRKKMFVEDLEFILNMLNDSDLAQSVLEDAKRKIRSGVIDGPVTKSV